MLGNEGKALSHVAGVKQKKAVPRADLLPFLSSPAGIVSAVALAMLRSGPREAIWGNRNAFFVRDELPYHEFLDHGSPGGTENPAAERRRRSGLTHASISSGSSQAESDAWFFGSATAPNLPPDPPGKVSFQAKLPAEAQFTHPSCTTAAVTTNGFRQESHGCDRRRMDKTRIQRSSEASILTTWPVRSNNRRLVSASRRNSWQGNLAPFARKTASEFSRARR